MHRADENIIDLLGAKEVIGQAIAVLMSEHDVSRDRAFELLVQDSSAAGERVRETAAGIIRRAHGRSSHAGGSERLP